MDRPVAEACQSILEGTEDVIAVPSPAGEGQREGGCFCNPMDITS
ncbi:MAG TPA: hypothetical protein VFZ59_23135 [Verrucomicrobiae bacterium]|nr:hypothetical protein [Verrucomicrobiae bacterium]